MDENLWKACTMEDMDDVEFTISLGLMGLGAAGWLMYFASTLLKSFTCQMGNGSSVATVCIPTCLPPQDDAELGEAYEMKSMKTGSSGNVYFET